MNTNLIKQRVARGECVTAAWLQLGSAEVAELLVRAGWDTLVIDGEHGVGDIETWVSIDRAVRSAGGETILRVPNQEASLLLRVLDRGFRTLLVPHVSSTAQARALVANCLYPPHGRRGYAAPLVRASGYGADAGYAANADQELMIIAQCEHVDACEAFSDISAVAGIDMVFIGPNDLAGSMNRLEQVDAADVRARIEQVESAAKSSGAALGTITGANQTHEQLESAGYRLVVGASDAQLLFGAARHARGESVLSRY